MSDEMADDDEKPLQQIDLNYGYWLARYPVTVAQFQAFVEATGHQVRDENSLRDLPNRPVRFVTWYEASAFCDWLTEKWQEEGALPSNWAVRLPGEAEWEKAARGGLQIVSRPLITNIKQGFDLPKAVKLEQNKQPQRRFPWGQEADLNRANYELSIGDASAAGCFPRGRSPYGCEDMSGNVWEWTRSHYKSYPYNPGDGRENLKAGDDVLRVLRGGAFLNLERLVRCAIRDGYNPIVRNSYLGFRVMVSPFS